MIHLDAASGESTLDVGREVDGRTITGFTITLDVEGSDTIDNVKATHWRRSVPPPDDVVGESTLTRQNARVGIGFRE